MSVSEERAFQVEGELAKTLRSACVFIPRRPVRLAVSEGGQEVREVKGIGL